MEEKNLFTDFKTEEAMDLMAELNGSPEDEYALDTDPHNQKKVRTDVIKAFKKITLNVKTDYNLLIYEQGTRGQIAKKELISRLLQEGVLVTDITNAEMTEFYRLQKDAAKKTQTNNGVFAVQRDVNRITS